MYCVHDIEQILSALNIDCVWASYFAPDQLNLTQSIDWLTDWHINKLYSYIYEQSSKTTARALRKLIRKPNITEYTHNKSIHNVYSKSGPIPLLHAHIFIPLRERRVNITAPNISMRLLQINIRFMFSGGGGGAKQRLKLPEWCCRKKRKVFYTQHSSTCAVKVNLYD